MMIPFLRGVAADQKGHAAIEFAFLFPILFVLHVAGAEALEVYRAQRAVAHIASAMADITAQNRTVTQAEMDDILLASTSMIYPYPQASLQQRVASLSASQSGTVSIDWQVKKAFTGTGNPSVPSGYLGANESTIVTTVIYDYQPTFGIFLPDTIRFTRNAYARPRLSTKIDKVP